MNRSKRYIWFFISILVGVAGGIFYGWVANPVRYVDTPPSNLRSDYKTDYVLMVAEVYSAEKDVAQASTRLAVLGGGSPLRLVQEAILNARKLGYIQKDVDLLAALAAALQAPAPNPGGTP
jgi:hypothetical protein